MNEFFSKLSGKERIGLFIAATFLFLALLDTKSGAKDVLENVNFLANEEGNNFKSAKTALTNTSSRPLHN